MIKLMSFNIRYGTADDGENHWENRKPLVIERIKTFDPDLLGLQECRDGAQAQFIKDALQGYEFLGVPRGGDHESGPEIVPILVKKSSFEVNQWETFWLSKTPHIPGSKSWGSTFPRTATWCQLRFWKNGRSLFYLNTHLDYEPSAIGESAKLVKSWIDKMVRDHPLLVTGDFNADKSSPAYQMLISGSSPLNDVFAGAASEGEPGTYHAFGRQVPPWPIDWMLASHHFEILSAGIDRTQAGSLYPSDHYPIAAVLRLT